MANVKDLRAKTDDQLNDQIIALKKESMNLRFQQTGGQLTNTARMRQVKREVAQIKTILTERKAGSKEEKDAQTYFAGCSRQRQNGQDGRR